MCDWDLLTWVSFQRLFSHRRYSPQVDDRRSTTCRRGPQSIEMRFCSAISPRHCEASMRSHDFILIHWSTQTPEYVSGPVWKSNSKTNRKNCHIVVWRGWNIIHFPSVKHYRELASSPPSAVLLYLLCKRQQEADKKTLQAHWKWAPMMHSQRDLILWWENESGPGPWGGLQGFNWAGHNCPGGPPADMQTQFKLISCWSAVYSSETGQKFVLVKKNWKIYYVYYDEVLMKFVLFMFLFSRVFDFHSNNYWQWATVECLHFSHYFLHFFFFFFIKENVFPCWPWQKSTTFM